jgi:hypothetical protein
MKIRKVSPGSERLWSFSNAFKDGQSVICALSTRHPSRRFTCSDVNFLSKAHKASLRLKARTTG